MKSLNIFENDFSWCLSLWSVFSEKQCVGDGVRSHPFYHPFYHLMRYGKVNHYLKDLMNTLTEEWKCMKFHVNHYVLDQRETSTERWKCMKIHVNHYVLDQRETFTEEWKCMKIHVNHYVLDQRKSLRAWPKGNIYGRMKMLVQTLKND